MSLKSDWVTNPDLSQEIQNPNWGGDAAPVGDCLSTMPEALNPTPRYKSRTKIPEMIDKFCLGALVFGLFVFLLFCFTRLCVSTGH